MDRVESICKKQGIMASLLEPNAYKNNTTDRMVNVDRLKREINNCYLVVSTDIRKEKTNEGYYEVYAYIFYIITDFDNKELLQKYFDISKKYNKVCIDAYRYDPQAENCISTLYTQKELGW